ncbi:PAS domain-containing protein, partial [Streptococcus pyogenes]
MTDQELLNFYIQLLPFLGQILGNHTEIVIHDVSQPAHSLIAIENPISGRAIGAPLTDMFRQMIADKEYEEKDFVANYNGSSKHT